MKPSIALWNSSRACKRRKASSVTRHGRHRTSPALHVTRKTRSRRLAVAPLHHGASRCTMEHNDATGVTTPRQTVKASPHRHKWMLSHGAPADPSDPWNSHAAPVSPRQTGQRALYAGVDDVRTKAADNVPLTELSRQERQSLLAQCPEARAFTRGIFGCWCS